MNKTPLVDKIITNATLHFFLKKDNWFTEVYTCIDFAVSKNPGLKVVIVKEWIARCDAMHASNVKAQIELHFVNKKENEP